LQQFYSTDSDQLIAKKVTFDPNVNLKSVTIDGDVYDPSGQLTGGAKTQSAGSLHQLQKLTSLQQERNETRQCLDVVTEKLEDILAQEQLKAGLQKKIDLKTHELQLLQQRMGNNHSFKVIQNFEILQQDYKQKTESLEVLKLRLQEVNVSIEKIQLEMNDFSSNRDTKLNSMKVRDI
jgi:structural maintenance of chromosome 2